MKSFLCHLRSNLLILHTSTPQVVDALFKGLVLRKILGAMNGRNELKSGVVPRDPDKTHHDGIRSLPTDDDLLDESAQERLLLNWGDLPCAPQCW